MDTKSEEFKLLIKELNFKSRTHQEQHEENQRQFRELMPLFALLSTEDEKRALIHQINNKERTSKNFQLIN